MRELEPRRATWSPGVVLGLRVAATVVLVLTGLAIWVIGFLALSFADNGQTTVQPGRTLGILSVVDAVVSLLLLLGVWRLSPWFSCLMFGYPLGVIALSLMLSL